MREEKGKPEDLPPLELRTLRELDLAEPTAEGREPHMGAASGVVRRGDFAYVIADDELRVDEGAFVALMHHLAAHGSDGFVVCGTTGEAPTLADDEHLIYESTGSGRRPCPRHKQPDLERSMPGFRIDSSYLLRNGMQEYLWVYKGSRE